MQIPWIALRMFMIYLYLREMSKLLVGLPLWTMGIKSKPYKKFESANDGVYSFIMENIKEAHEQGHLYSRSKHLD